jgi:hypothetical protein
LYRGLLCFAKAFLENFVSGIWPGMGAVAEEPGGWLVGWLFPSESHPLAYMSGTGRREAGGLLVIFF